MKDCRKCGEAFEPKSKYGQVCEDCKYEVYENIKYRNNTSRPYWKRNDFITQK